MTKTYNRFHDRGETAADIVCLRELHAAMDRAVLAAYAWPDLASSADPIFLDDSNEDDHTYQYRLDCSAAQGDLCREAPTRPVARPSRSPASGPIDNYPGGTLLH